MRSLALCFALAIVLGSGAQAEDLGPTLKRIKSAGAINIGHLEKAFPLSYLDDQQKPAGYSLDLCALVVEKVKAKLGLPDLKISYRPVVEDTRLALVKDGSVDLECGATAATAARRKEAGFSVPIFVPELRWVALRRWRLQNTDSLKNKSVVLMPRLDANNLMLALSTERTLGLSIFHAKSYADAIQYLEAGKAYAFLDDDVMLAGLVAMQKRPDFYTMLDDAFPSEPYALMFQKDDKPFKELVDGVLVEAMKSGEFAKIHAKWLESPIPPKNVNLAVPMSAKLRAVILKNAGSSK